MIYQDDNVLSISGIQHFVYCRRQWALIHIEQQKAHDNTFSETRNGVVISRGMQVSSYELGIYGVCDVVEFVPSSEGAIIHNKEGYFKIIPVEYKHGEPKTSDADILQVAAQAMCLENMFCAKIDELNIRERLVKILEEMHQLYDKRYTPKVKQNKNCRACSLKNICLPRLTKISSVKGYMSKMLGDEL